MGDRPTDVGRHEVEKLLHRRCEPGDCQPFVEKQRCRLRARQQVVQIIGGALQLQDLLLELAVDGVQLLVEGLQLFLGGFELLVGRLKLLVHRDCFLVRGLQFLVGGPEVLDGVA
ncbi:hypothetical protein D9M69_706340 [compost metagenome]